MTKNVSRSAFDSTLVVGATGTVGSRLVRQLAAAGLKPRALVRSPEKGDAISSLATPVLGNLLAPETLAEAFHGAERVFILAPPMPELEIMERNAFDAAIAAGAKHIVFLSNYGAAEGDADWHFDVHGRNERLLTSLGVDWTLLRPTRFMNYVPFVWPSVLESNLLLEAGGEGRMTFIDPDDIAAVAVKALTEDGHEGQTYELTSEETYTAAQLAALFSRVLRRPIRVFDGGDVEALRAALIECGAPSEYAPIMAEYYEKIAAGFYKPTDTAARLLGRLPRTYADWLEQNLPVPQGVS